MVKIYLMWFVPEGDDDEEKSLLIGVYSSERDAKTAIERLRGKRGQPELSDLFCKILCACHREIDVYWRTCLATLPSDGLTVGKSAFSGRKFRRRNGGTICPLLDPKLSRERQGFERA